MVSVGDCLTGNHASGTLPRDTLIWSAAAKPVSNLWLVELPSMINGGFFAAVVGDVKGIFCGHDHINNHVGLWRGVARRLLELFLSAPRCLVQANAWAVAAPLSQTEDLQASRSREPTHPKFRHRSAPAAPCVSTQL